MLAVSPLRDIRDEKQGEMEGFDCGGGGCALSGGRRDDLMDDESFDHFSADGNLLLESIDFDDLFVGINDGDVLPDLEMDADILADFSVVSPGLSGEESVSNGQVENYTNYYCPVSNDEEELDKISGSGSGSGSGLDSSLSTRGEEIVSKRVEEVNIIIPSVSRAKLDGENGRKPSHSNSAQAKHNQGKRKLKVDWTPELHRRFVQAVEQLGVDKAVPSRILELMGIDCLTRHNIASHLQKYRSHRKHLLAREAEAASWTQRRQMYGGGTVVVGGGGGGGKRLDVVMNQCHAPTMGFPPVPPPPMHHFRPLHVWGHPSMDNSVMHMWPKHLLPHPTSAIPPPPAPWLAHLPPPDPSYWHHHHHNQKVRTGAACFPQPGVVAQARFRAATATSNLRVPRIPSPPPPPQPVYKVDPSAAAAAAVVPTTGQPAGPHPLFDLQPSKESIDAAIGDVMSKPWLPLPLGLKPPSTDGVLVELQRQGIPKIPPTGA